MLTVDPNKIEWKGSYPKDPVLRRLFFSWNSMRTRCNNKKSKDYSNYGGRGIKICKKWSTFKGFLEDMVDSYIEGLQIDRINNNGDYTKENCKWSNIKQQANNRRSNIVWVYKGISKTLMQWSEEVGINFFTLYSRYYESGWSLERTLTTPVRGNYANS